MLPSKIKTNYFNLNLCNTFFFLVDFFLCSSDKPNKKRKTEKKSHKSKSKQCVIWSMVQSLLVCEAFSLCVFVAAIRKSWCDPEFTQKSLFIMEFQSREFIHTRRRKDTKKDVFYYYFGVATIFVIFSLFFFSDWNALTFSSLRLQTQENERKTKNCNFLWPKNRYRNWLCRWHR